MALAVPAAQTVEVVPRVAVPVVVVVAEVPSLRPVLKYSPQVAVAVAVAVGPPLPAQVVAAMAVQEELAVEVRTSPVAPPPESKAATEPRTRAMVAAEAVGVTVVVRGGTPHPLAVQLQVEMAGPDMVEP